MKATDGAIVSDNMTNVVFVLNSLCFGGAEKQVVSLLNHMDKSRFALSLVRLKPVDDLLEQLNPQIRTGGTQCLGVRKGIDWGAVRRLAQHIDEKKAGAVICTNMYALLYAWLARWSCNSSFRLVEVFHTTDVGSRKEQLSMWLYRFIVRWSDLIVYVCWSQARHWRARGLNCAQETVIYNGIDTKRFADTWSSEQKGALRRTYGLHEAEYVVGLCSVMRPEKAHGDLVAAIAHLRQQGLTVKALLIGDGPERPRIERQIESLGLAGYVHITGLLQDVRPAIAACDVMVLASHAVETFSIAALESMAMGRPMVVSRIGGAEEQVRHGVDGLLFPPGDVAALADCLRKLSEPSRREAMGAEAARRTRETFDVDVMARAYEDMLLALTTTGVVRGNVPGPVERLS
jgi:glycosyltransferase involved in cell wall biosynthesis